MKRLVAGFLFSIMVAVAVLAVPATAYADSNSFQKFLNEGGIKYLIWGNNSNEIVEIKYVFNPNFVVSLKEKCKQSSGFVVETDSETKFSVVCAF